MMIFNLIDLQVCSTYVPEGICTAFNCPTWRQVVLSTVNQHAVASQSRSSNEGNAMPFAIPENIPTHPKDGYQKFGNSKGERC